MKKLNQGMVDQERLKAVIPDLKEEGDFVFFRPSGSEENKLLSVAEEASSDVRPRHLSMLCLSSSSASARIHRLCSSQEFEIHDDGDYIVTLVKLLKKLFNF